MSTGEYVQGEYNPWEMCPEGIITGKMSRVGVVGGVVGSDFGLHTHTHTHTHCVYEYYRKNFIS